MAARVEPEADQRLRAVVVAPLGRQVAELVAGLDRVLRALVAARADEDLDARATPGRSAIASCLSSRQARLERDRAERVQRHRHDHGAGRERLARARSSTSTPSRRLRDRRDRRGEPRLELRAAGDRVEQRPRAALDRDPAAGVLREREAEPESTCQRTTANAPASCAKPWASDSHSASSTSRSSSSSPSSSMRSRIVCRSNCRHRRRRRRAARTGAGAPARRPSTNRFQPRSAIASRSAGRAGAALAADPPAGGRLGIGELDADAAARDLRPGVGLVPVHPAAAVLDLLAVPVGRPGAPAEAVLRLQQQRAAPRQRDLAGRRHAGEPAADHDHVVHASTPWYICTVQMYQDRISGSAG